jgi:predicted DsbA family dithiol-disulfide isomerase
MSVRIDLFTDPLCPWAYSAEPQRLRLRWLYGEQLEWVPRMVVLAERGEDQEAHGFTPDVQLRAFTTIQGRFGMPIELVQRPRMTGSLEACRWVVAVREHAGVPQAEALLRRLRVAHFRGALIDEPDVIAAAAEQAGLSAPEVAAWAGEEAVELALREDVRAARDPLPAALALDHKLAGWEGGRRYTCPTYVARDGGAPEVAPGFQPLESYEVLLANLDPALERREDPGSVEEVLAWAGVPLATAEVAMVCGLDREEARERLREVAVEDRIGPEGLWALR